VGSGQNEVENLSKKLAESYEEISLLYTLREHMNELAQPTRFLRQACHELNEVVPFTWVAARLVPGGTRTLSIGGDTFMSGGLPCDSAAFERFSSDLMGTLEAGQFIALDGPNRGPLARGESQVLVYPIARDGKVIGAFLAGDKNGPDMEVTNIDLK